MWDEAGRRFRDMGHHSIGAAALRYCDPEVTRAVLRRVELSSYSILNSREDPEVAELLCALHPWAEQVRFARAATSAAAPRWTSTWCPDWSRPAWRRRYATPASPSTTATWRPSTASSPATNGGSDHGAVPPPSPAKTGFLEHIRAQARRVGALLVFDEARSVVGRGHGRAHLR